MLTINEAAQKAAVNYNVETGNAAAALDPATISVFASLIVPLIQEIAKCIAARQAQAAAGNPTGMQKLSLGLMVRRQVGIREFRQNGHHYVNTLLKTAADTTPEDMEGLFQQAQDYEY